MEHTRPVFWYQGLFLQPQHFQQFDRYVQSLTTPFASYLHPYFFGLRALDINRDTLRNNVFEITRGEFLFPDRTWTIYPGNAVIAPRTVPDGILSAGKPFRVYLGLRNWDRAEKNVSLLKSGESPRAVTTRFVSPVDPEEISDIHQGGPPAQVKLMKYALAVIFEHEREEYAEWSLIPVAELLPEERALALSDRYIPPSLNIGASPVLAGLVRGIGDQIDQRRRKLEEYKSVRGMQASGADTGYILYMLALRSLARSVPLIDHLTAGGDVHPWDVYGLFRAVIGELSTYTTRIDSLGRLPDGAELVPPYDHENLYNCFSEVQVLIAELLATIMIGPESIIRLDQENGMYSAHIPADILSGERAYYLTISTAESSGAVLSAMERIVKVSSMNLMKTLLARALPGIALIRNPVPPPGIPTRPNAYYFELDQTHVQWPEIQKDRSLCLAWNKAPADLTVELVVLRR